MTFDLATLFLTSKILLIYCFPSQTQKHEISWDYKKSQNLLITNHLDCQSRRRRRRRRRGVLDCLQWFLPGSTSWVKNVEPKPFYEVFINLHPKHVVQCATEDALTIGSTSWAKNVDPKPFYEVFTNCYPKHVVQCATGDALTIGSTSWVKNVEPKPFYDINLHLKHVVQCATGDALTIGSTSWAKNIEPKPFYEVFTNRHPKHVV